MVSFSKVKPMDIPKIEKSPILILEEAGTGLFSLLLQNMGFTNLLRVSSEADAIGLLQKSAVQLCIIDLEAQISTQTGLQFAIAIRQYKPELPFIFLTNHYNPKTYQKVRHLQPTAFLNKDLSRLKLYQALDAALREKHLMTTSVRPKENQLLQPVFFKIGDAYKAFQLKEIAYFFAKDKMVFARIASRDYPSNLKLKELEKELYPTFLRLQKSYLINRKHIRAIHIGAATVELNTEHLPIGLAYRKAFLKELNIIK